jgi:hypothetical protein
MEPEMTRVVNVTGSSERWAMASVKGALVLL